MRERVIPSVIVTEDISNVIHVQGLSVVVVLSAGTMVTEHITLPIDPDNPPAIALAPPTVERTFFRAISGKDAVYKIEHGDYDELMSASPSWSPGKPAGVFRYDDLWYYVDKYRAA